MAIKDLFSKFGSNTTASEEGSAEKHRQPPKDENGNPIKPPEGFRPSKDGKMPEPPKDENGNPIKPPKGAKPPFDWKKPSE